MNGEPTVTAARDDGMGNIELLTAAAECFMEQGFTHPASTTWRAGWAPPRPRSTTTTDQKPTP